MGLHPSPDDWWSVQLKSLRNFRLALLNCWSLDATQRGCREVEVICDGGFTAEREI
jgi:hypothetical protein